MIAGFYGMNFENMPELHWTFGYPLVIAVVVAVCFTLYRYFRRIGWLERSTEPVLGHNVHGRPGSETFRTYMYLILGWTTFRNL